MTRRCVDHSGRCWAADWGAGGWRLAAGGRTGEGLGDFEEGHAEFEEGAVEEVGLVRGEIALGFFAEDAEHVDALAGAEDVDLGLLAFGGGSAELHDGGHVDGLDELLEAHGGRVLHAGVGGADGGVEAVGGHLVGEAGLLGSARRWGRGGCRRGGLPLRCRVLSWPARWIRL